VSSLHSEWLVLVESLFLPKKLNSLEDFGEALNQQDKVNGASLILRDCCASLAMTKMELVAAAGFEPATKGL
jgi:hypothetical protein